MKWFLSLLVLTAFGIVLALPNEHGLAKRSDPNDAADIGYATVNGGTSGGSGGPVITVTSLAALTAAVSGTAKKVVMITGVIAGNAVVEIGSNTSLIGRRDSALVGVGLRVFQQNNVIIRNVRVSKVLAEVGDAIGIQEANQVWIDHADLSSDRDHDKVYYDGLLDITHGSTGITVSYCRLSNHWKASLVGHSDSNGAEDAKITVTYAYNYWLNINSRTPSFRFGHGHIFNNVYDDVNDGINTRVGAELLVENNVFSNCPNPLYSTSEGFAVARGNDFGGATNGAPIGSFFTPPYLYTLIPTSQVRSIVLPKTGQILAF